MPRQNQKREPLPCVSYTRPRCPYCDDPRSRTRNVLQTPNGHQLNYVTCGNSKCKRRYSILGL